MNSVRTNVVSTRPRRICRYPCVIGKFVGTGVCAARSLPMEPPPMGSQQSITPSVQELERDRGRPSPSLRRPVRVKTVCFFLVGSLALSRLCRRPSIRTLVERFSLGASWAYSFEQVLLPDNRPRLASLR